MLYTGTPGSEGTLGGLLEVGKRIEDHLAAALGQFFQLLFQAGRLLLYLFQCGLALLRAVIADNAQQFAVQRHLAMHCAPARTLVAITTDG